MPVAALQRPCGGRPGDPEEHGLPYLHRCQVGHDEDPEHGEEGGGQGLEAER